MCAPACAHGLQNQIWNAKVLVLERQDKDSYVLALASPDQHFLDGAPLELCLPLGGAQIATHGDREVSVCLPDALPASLPSGRLAPGCGQLAVDGAGSGRCTALSLTLKAGTGQEETYLAGWRQMLQSNALSKTDVHRCQVSQAADHGGDEARAGRARCCCACYGRLVLGTRRHAARVFVAS